MHVAKSIELAADPTTVWDALTNPERTKQYFFGCEAISTWKVGAKLDYRCEFEGESITVVTGEIRAIDPGRSLEVTCRGIQDGIEGHETIATYSLEATEAGTRLSITQGEFPDEGSSAQHEASWDTVLGGLKTLVEA